MPVRRGCGNSGRTFEDLAKAFSVAANVDPMRRRSFSPSSFFREYSQFWRGRCRPIPVQDWGAYGFPMAPVLIRMTEVSVVTPGKSDVDTASQGTQVRVLLPYDSSERAPTKANGAGCSKNGARLDLPAVGRPMLVVLTCDWRQTWNSKLNTCPATVCVNSTTNALTHLDPAATLESDITTRIVRVDSALPEQSPVAPIQAAGFHLTVRTRILQGEAGRPLSFRTLLLACD